MERKYDVATRYLFLNMAIKVLEQDLQHINAGAFKIKSPYLESIENMITKAIEERRNLKAIMYQEKISIQLMKRDNLFTSYRWSIYCSVTYSNCNRHHISRKKK